ncbi:hypothetical protein HYR82_03120 [Candidatus Peregrinibacteria bacterium]|nr:hypothetical protein [Candidatus Peregrinibacteria bacterium]
MRVLRSKEIERNARVARQMEQKLKQIIIHNDGRWRFDISQTLRTDPDSGSAGVKNLWLADPSSRSRIMSILDEVRAEQNGRT